MQRVKPIVQRQQRVPAKRDDDRLPEIEGDTPAKKKFKTYPLGYFHVDIAEVQTAEV